MGYGDIQRLSSSSLARFLSPSLLVTWRRTQPAPQGHGFHSLVPLGGLVGVCVGVGVGVAECWYACGCGRAWVWVWACVVLAARVVGTGACVSLPQNDAPL